MALQEFKVGECSILLDVRKLSHVIRNNSTVNFSLMTSGLPLIDFICFSGVNSEQLAIEMYELIKQAWSVQREIAEEFRNKNPQPESEKK